MVAAPFPTLGVQFRVLGSLEAVVEGRLVDLGPPKQRVLLALLVSRVGHPVAVDVLVEELWAGTPPAAAVTSLRSYVANLRRVLEPHRAPRAPAALLRRRSSGYVLDSRGVDIDAHRFGEHASAGWEAWGRGDPQRALREFNAGLALWRGQAYAELADAGWGVPEVARLEELRLSVAEGRCAALLDLGSHELAVAELEAHVQTHPLRERGCELLALALYRSGRQADALAVLRAIRMRLVEELGIDPGPPLQRLEHDILTQNSALDWQPATSPCAVATGSSVAPEASATGPASGEQEVSRALLAALRDLSQTRSEDALAGRVWNVPARSSGFTGREELLSALHAALDDQRSPRWCRPCMGWGGSARPRWSSSTPTDTGPSMTWCGGFPPKNQR
jgi:DNA-binding SARP family transcriptional activator